MLGRRRAVIASRATRSPRRMRSGCSRTYPVLGKKYNPNLMIRQKINPGETIDRMVSVRFPGTEEALLKAQGASHPRHGRRWR